VPCCSVANNNGEAPQEQEHVVVPAEPGGEGEGFMAKTVERCRRSLGRRRLPPAGCFSVLVGPEKERFAVRAERANHPLFRALLDEAEAEYGFPRHATAGPLVLPCGAEEFRRVMSEVERDEHREEEEEDVARGAAVAGGGSSPGWRFFWRGGGARVGYLKMHEPRAPTHTGALLAM
jgi:SAUR family protein